MLVKAHKKPPFRRRRLGKRLRTMREAAGLTLETAAPRLDLTRSSLFRIESGATRATVHLVRSMMDLYDHYEEGLLDAVRDAVKPSWFTKYGIQDVGYIDAETEASRVYEYSGMQLPGLLHAEPYMRTLFERSLHRRTPEMLENDVTVRLIRQQRLTSVDDPLELVAIIDEAALRREIGGAEVMRAQLHQLVEMAALPTVTLQVLQMDGCPPAAMNGGFILLDFPDPDEPELLYHEYVTGALHIEDENEVREARLVFDSLRSEALNPADSVALIEQIAALRYVQL
ncbi:MAG TPA: helix-turn-helix transcriptional regulator [Actinophytocola sp.]|uniref:helix-turn-helix domain-containing protein n=1 Tax=Actinophytocola sp. TaxID=1872138 RepID=UPI002DDD27DF|nr:helix-turn-helix transcriptional regulator [Actinophytocola sp.]HEV2779699.1 helix-turn-helix transcriptional regulator [Actinophytocola sp.]